MELYRPATDSGSADARSRCYKQQQQQQAAGQCAQWGFHLAIAPWPTASTLLRLAQFDARLTLPTLHVLIGMGPTAHGASKISSVDQNSLEAKRKCI